MKAQSVTETLKRASRRILVTGSSGTGKTTFSVSASAYAGDTIPAPTPRMCKDVAVIQGDTEGVTGAWRAGFEPFYVYDLSSSSTWAQYESALLGALREIKATPEIKYVVVDLALPNRLIHAAVQPNNPAQWAQLSQLGASFFNAFTALSGVTTIGNAQLKPSAGIVESANAADASHVRAVGGERCTYTPDLYKGVGLLWTEHVSLHVARELRRKKADKVGGAVAHYSSHTQSNGRFEAKSRFHDVLLPTEPGERTLHSILKAAYQDAL